MITVQQLKDLIEQADDQESVLIKHDDEILVAYSIEVVDGDLIISADPNDEEGDDEE